MVELYQIEFDALLMLAFNIGAEGFRTSSVVKLLNEPTARTTYRDLESAWKAWNRTQGKVSRGLVQRRACEWNIFARGAYRQW
jgi:lysozyme